MSPEALIALLLITAALLAWAAWRGRTARRQLLALEESLRHAEAAGKEQAARIAALESLRDTQQLSEHAIATGTALVREVHKGIADIPFSVLEAIPATRGSAKALRGLHDSISEGVYGALAGLNKAVGRELRKAVPLDEPPLVKTADPKPPETPLAEEPAAKPEAEPPTRGWG